MTDFPFDRIEQAHRALAEVVKRTPLIPSRTFSAMTGSRVCLKLENLQDTGSFKLRGAFNKIRQLTPEERQRGVVCASAGNHAQGVAYAAAAMGVQSTVFMPLFAPPAKIQATRGYGAHVELVGTIYDEAYAAARAYAQAHGAVLVHAFDDPQVIAGQGSIGVEIFEDLGEVDVVLCPTGGGGLIAGVAAALKHLKPGVRVVGVEAEGAQSMKLSLEQGRIVPMTSMTTIADGIAVKVPGEVTFPLVQRYVDEMVTVDDEETAYALYLLLQRAKLLAEPAGAVSLAALLCGRVAFPGQTVVVLVSGGNVDLALLTQIVERGLIRDGLRAKIAVDVPDRPGTLDDLLDILAGLQANIQFLTHDRFTASVPIGHVRVTVTFRTLGREQIARIEEALRARNLAFQVLT